MTESILLMLLATVVVFIIARLMKDAKAFTRLMAILAVSAIVGAGVKETVIKAASTPEKATVVSTKAIPTQSSLSPFVLEETNACLDSVSQENIARDSVETEVEGTPTIVEEIGYIDDS